MIVFSLYLFIFTNYINPALALILIGALTVALLHDDFVDLETSEAELSSSFSPLDTLLTSLNVKNNGIYIPTSRELDEPRVFIQAGKVEIAGVKKDIPPLDEDSTLIEGEGIAVEPPGLPLFERAREQIEEEASGELSMTQLTDSLNLARSFSFDETDQGYRLRITHGPYGDYCEKTRKRSDFVCERTACPLCSSYLIAAAQEVNKPLRIKEFKIEDGHILYKLEEM